MKKDTQKSNASDKNRGKIYIMTNRIYREDVIKWGRTKKTTDERADELFTTGVPTPFEVYAEMECDNVEEVENMTHNILTRAGLRVHPRREFFYLTPQDALGYLQDFSKLVGGKITRKNYSPVCDEEEEERSNKLKGQFRFSHIGINIGDEVECVFDGKKYKVGGDREIEHEGSLWRLTSFVNEYIPNEMRCKSEKYRGPKYFTYNGKRLSEMWDEMYKGED